MKTVELWEGELGTQYTERNVVDPAHRVAAFRTMLGGLNLHRVLEVGCNRGHNLIALRNVLPAAELVGIEPNDAARQIAEKEFPVLKADTSDLLFRTGCFDLVFTAGVLIHIPLVDLSDSMREIARVTSKYVLAIEYFSEVDTEIPYRGNTGLLWKRDFLKYFAEAVPSLSLERSGYWSKEEGFDRCHWWLLKHRQG